jgi:hypothetical protein
MRLKLCALIVSAFALWGTIEPAAAGTISGVSNLQDLINRGASPGNGIQIGNDVFYNFSYAGSPAPGAPGAATPSAILVTSTNTGTGLHFAFPWNASGGNNQASNISYFVHAVDPQQLVSGATLNMQSSVNALTLADNASTTETFSNTGDLSAFAQQSVANTTTNPSTVFTNNLPLSPVRDFAVSNGIVAHSGANPGGTASITYVENVFQSSAVPEPATLSLFATAAVTLLARRRRPL